MKHIKQSTYIVTEFFELYDNKAYDHKNSTLSTELTLE